MPALVMYQLKDVEEDNLQNVFGYVPYGEEVMVRVSPTMGDPMYWVHMMSAGASGFFGTNYVVVRSTSLEELVKQVQDKLETKTKYLLHGLPHKNVLSEGDVQYTQTLVEWNSGTSYARGRQLFGSFISQFSLEDKPEGSPPAEKTAPIEEPPESDDLLSDSESDTEASAENNTEGSAENDTEASAENNTEGSAENDTEGSAGTDTEGSAGTDTEGSAGTDTEGSAGTDTEGSTESDAEGSADGVRK
jgi:hypothetical protein